jgi:phospholipid/cholesterol/gamma-HCH transport system substrate-binding protein
MRSNSNLRAIIVGVFVVLGLGILIVTILTLGSQHKTFEKSITIKSFFDNVNGLQKGNNIWFSGVKVGIIREVNLRQDGTVEVDMSIEDKSVKYIPGDARAKLSSDGLIGNKIIEIYGGTASAPKIEQGGVLANEKLLNTDQMMSTLSKNNDNLYAITSDFKAISARIASGKGSIGKLLNDETMVDHLEKLTSNVAAYTNKLNDKGTLASDLVTDTVIFSKLRSTVLQLQNLADSSQNVIANLTNTGKIINNGLTNKNSPAGMLLNDEQSANKIKGTLQNLQSATKKLDEDLEAVQHNFLLRKFFKNKAKEEKENQKVVLDTVVTQ